VTSNFKVFIETNLGPLWFEGISKEFWRISFLWIDSYEALWFTGEVKE
jgi:hypothetical protein